MYALESLQERETMKQATVYQNSFVKVGHCTILWCQGRKEDQ